MRARLPLVLVFLFFTTSLFAKEVWLAVSGTANGVFFSDARIFNPTDHQITVLATYLPRGNGDNSAEQPVSFTIGTRKVKIADDIVATVLHRGDVGAIRFTSADDFVVTQRVYLAGDCDPSPAVTLPCTLGQFVQGQDVANALKKGVILQIKSNAKFRANIGAANTSTAIAHVTWRLYDKNDAIIATKTEDLQPYGVLGPSEVAGYIGAPSGADLSDAWVGFVSDQPILAYGSVVDNISGDQTAIPASLDSGTVPPDPVPTEKTVNITARDFAYSVSSSAALKKGDQVKFRVSKTAGSGDHGFELFDPQGNPLIILTSLGTTPVERTVTVTQKGTYIFFCTNSSCGIGHTDMTGEVNVEETTSPVDGPPKY
jgi:heme/copper-type cytochrome/quinol oxidase subunit 2